MEEVLLRRLIDKKHFNLGTEVDARRKNYDVSGMAQHMFEDTFTVVGLMERQKSKRLVLEIASIRNGEKVRVDPEQITGIDGMTPERFAENYMIHPDGTDIKVVGARRGRRPKNWNPETQQVDPNYVPKKD